LNNSFYSSSIKDLVGQFPEAILGHLAKQNPFSLDALQRNAWLAQISILQRELASLDGGWIAFEFAIPRMGKRADNIILFGGTIFVLEFKVRTEQFDIAAQDQVVDYALDLKNFHGGSHDRPIVPIVVATDPRNRLQAFTLSRINPVIPCGKALRFCRRSRRWRRQGST
jgi:hypothetical protein